MKKAFSIIGMISGLALTIIGILVLFGVFGGEAYRASGASYIYDSGYATFGADYYNYVSNNAAEAASAAKTIASNLVEIAKLMKSVLGWGMILIGIMSACAFGNSFMKINECVTGREAENLTDRSVVDQAD